MPFLSPGDLPELGMKPGSPSLQADSLLSELPGKLLSIICLLSAYSGFPGGSVGKESACNTGDLDMIPELGRSSGEGNGNPLQYSFLENRMEEPDGL